MAGALSRSDKVLLEEAESLIRRIQTRAGTSKSILQVLEADPMLLGETLMISRVFLQLDHLRIDDPLIAEFIYNRSS